MKFCLGLLLFSVVAIATEPETEDALSCEGGNYWALFLDSASKVFIGTELNSPQQFECFPNGSIIQCADRIRLKNRKEAELFDKGALVEKLECETLGSN